MYRVAWLPLAVLGACSQADETAVPDGEASAVAAQQPQNPPGPVSGRPAQGDAASRYTQLSACTLLRSNPEEGGFYEHACIGEGGYRLRLTESDLRQNIIVLTPDGGEHSLELSALANGAFNSVEGAVEWRGEVAGGSFNPRAMILRQSVVEDPDPSVPERSYLVVARLEPNPCVVARIPAGPDQNESARAAAGASGACLGQ